MPQSLSNVFIHTIFSTKHRQNFLSDTSIRQDAHKYLAGIVKNLGCHPVNIGGVADHVHLLTTLSRTITIADFTKEVKRVSSHWLKDEVGISGFQWQAGYGSFSVSPSLAPEVEKYILNQDEHHKKMTFKEEFRIFCKKHDVEIDERYVWD